MTDATERLVILASPLLAFITYVLGQFIAANIRHHETPRLERDSALASAERAINIMHSAMVDLQGRVAELEGDVARLERENARLHQQIAVLTGQASDTTGNDRSERIRQVRAEVREARTALGRERLREAQDQSPPAEP